MVFTPSQGVPRQGRKEALRGHQPEFGKMATYRIDGLGPLAHQKIASAEHHCRSLLFLTLDCHITHRRPLRSFADRLRIGGIVLLPLSV